MTDLLVVLDPDLGIENPFALWHWFQALQIYSQCREYCETGCYCIRAKSARASEPQRYAIAVRFNFMREGFFLVSLIGDRALSRIPHYPARTGQR